MKAQDFIVIFSPIPSLVHVTSIQQNINTHTVVKYLLFEEDNKKKKKKKLLRFTKIEPIKGEEEEEKFYTFFIGVNKN